MSGAFAYRVAVLVRAGFVQAVFVTCAGGFVDGLEELLKTLKSPVSSRVLIHRGERGEVEAVPF